MNELELERELLKLRPAPPSPGLESRLAGLLDAPDATQWRRPATVSEPGPFMRWLDRLLWTGFGAAATALLVFSLRPHEAHVVSPLAEAPEAAVMKRVFTSEEDLGWRDEGVRFDSQGRPVRRLTRVAVEREAWADLKDAGVIQVEKPRQEVLLMPVSLH